MRGATGDVQHMIDRLVEERTVMTDHHDGLTKLAEVRLQPARGIEVEVVRRFVEQQQLGRCRQLRCEPHAASLTSTQPLQQPRARFHGVEVQALQHLVDARGKVVAALVHELLLQASVPVHQRLVTIAQFLGQHLEFLLDRDERRVGRSGSLPHRRRIAEVPVLIEQ